MAIKKGLNPNKKIKSKCQYSEKCGACQYIDMPYEEQLKEKQKMMNNLLGKYKSISPIIGMENPYHYRHKVHAVFHRNKDKKVISGIYEEKSHNVVAIDDCLIENEKARNIIKTVTKLLQDFKIMIYNEKSDFGLVKHIVVRVGYYTDEIMVILVTASPMFPSKNNFVKELVKKHPEITTVVQNVNEKRTTMVLGDRNITLYKNGYIMDKLCGKTFKISPNSFYQINPTQTEILYQKAIEFAELKKTDTVLDAYCGTGTIGIIVAEHVSEVIGVELNKEAIKDAKTNAKLNNTRNISFYNNDAARFITGILESKKTIDVVIMDPPRSGSSEAFLDALNVVQPQKIVYISCGPESLARDIEYLLKKKIYKVEKIQPVDMFAQSYHCESVCLLTKKD